MPGEVPWRELTPGAQDVMRREVETLLESVPAQHNVPVIRRQLAQQPELFPFVLAGLKDRLREA